MQTPLRPLGIVKEVIEEIGQEITYAYDDLVFIGHNDFLLQFAAEPNLLQLYFNSECPAEEAETISGKLLPAAGGKGLIVSRIGTFTMIEEDGENLKITFNP
jgi:hypothetical protein